MIVDRLDGLARYLRELGRPVVDLLRPGAAAADLDEAGIRSQDVRDWFGWRNGVVEAPGQTQGDVSVIPGYWPVSVEEALKLKPSYHGDPTLGDTWIPLLTSGGGDIYAAVWKGGSQPAVAGVLIGEPTEIEFPTIEVMLDVFLACFERRAYFVGERGYLEEDPSSYEEIYEELIGGEF